MYDERSTNYDLPLPHLTNPLQFDVARLRSTITTLDTLLKNIETAANAAMRYVGYRYAANKFTVDAATNKMPESVRQRCSRIYIYIYMGVVNKLILNMCHLIYTIVVLQNIKNFKYIQIRPLFGAFYFIYNCKFYYKSIT